MDYHVLNDIKDRGGWRDNRNSCGKNTFIKNQLPLVTLLCPPPPLPPINLLTMWTLHQINQLSSWLTLPWFPGVPNFPTGPGRPFSPFSPKGPGGPGGPTAEIPGSPFWPIRDYSSSNITVLIPSITVRANTNNTINADCNSVLVTPALQGNSYSNCVLRASWKRYFKSCSVQTQRSQLIGTNKAKMNIATNF